MTRWAALAVFVGSVVVANALTARFGFVPIGFGLSATAGTYAAGVALVARDVVQEGWGWRGVAVAVAAGVALSVWLATPALAVASGVAFAVSEGLDAAVYTPLRRRRWRSAVVGSSLVGAVADSVLFVGLAFGWAAVTAPTIAGQVVGKVLWVAVPYVVAVGVWRAVSDRSPVSERA